MSKFIVRTVVAFGVLVILFFISFVSNLSSLLGPGGFMITEGTEKAGTKDAIYEFCRDLAHVRADVIGYVSEFGTADVERFLKTYKTASRNIDRIAHFAGDHYRASSFQNLPNEKDIGPYSRQDFLNAIDESEARAKSCFETMKSGKGSDFELYASING